MDIGGDWVRLDVNFDNILFSMENLFAITIYEGWSFIMFYAFDVTKKDE